MSLPRPQRSARVRTRALLLGAALLVPAAPAAAQSFASTVVVSGIDRPVQVLGPEGDPDRLFVVEQHTGNVRIIRNGVLLPTPFVTVTGLSTLNEQGLLGLAFSPDFVNDGVFYVAYTETGGGCRVARYTVSAPVLTTDVANPTGDVILAYSNPGNDHNGGMMAFGPDGYLYIGTGDGGTQGGQGDPDDLAQNVNVIHGKMLRIDPSGDDFPTDSLRDYAIPTGQPAFGGLPELWMIGLRHPWRWSFDRANGDVWIGDVGHKTREEINLDEGGLGGQNWGWRCREGTGCFLDSAFCTCTTGTLTDPVYDYAWQSARAVIGGYVYRGSQTCGQGLYFFAEAFSGRIWTAEKDGSGGVTVVERTSELSFGGPTAPSSFGEDMFGNLYLCDLFGGEVHRILVNCFPPGIDHCNGDGGDQTGCTNCPCGNNAFAGTIGGCLNSAGSASRLLGSGNPSISADSLRFELAGAPPSAFCVLTSGGAVAPTNSSNPCFGLESGIQFFQFDGLRCAVQGTKRHGGRSADAAGNVGQTTPGWGPPSGPPAGLAASGGFVAGQSRAWQVIHRDDPLLGCMRGLNATQAVTYTWLP